MLKELHIRNLAVIKDAALELGPGLNVFTGGTGAGKSLLLGAIEGLLGLKRVGGLLREGADSGRISGVFVFSKPAIAAAVGEALDIELEPGEELLLTRKLYPSGRTSLNVNGSPVTAAMLRAASEHMIDIHGQHDHQYLLKPSHQLQMLDAFAEAVPLREAYAGAYRRVRNLRERQAELTASSDLRAQKLDLYRFQVGEIDAVEPEPGELDTLQAREQVMRHAATLAREASEACVALDRVDGCVAELLRRVIRGLEKQAAVDASLGTVLDELEDAAARIEGSADALEAYAERQEHDPAEAAEVEDRLNALNKLIAKYTRHGAFEAAAAEGADAASRLLAVRTDAAKRLAALEAEETDVAGLDDAIASAEAELASTGTRLMEVRARAVTPLELGINKQLEGLGMKGASLRVELTPGDPSPDGPQRMELLARTNPGASMKPLRQIASGGEMSRIMLALKSVVAASDRVSVLVFDEIDANIGGRLGRQIGEKLRGLAHRDGKDGRDEHQVLCITHLPQIAAFGDLHFKIAKHTDDEDATTGVSLLGQRERVEELAQMITGERVTAVTRKQARELMAAAG